MGIDRYNLFVFSKSIYKDKNINIFSLHDLEDALTLIERWHNSRHKQILKKKVFLQIEKAKYGDLQDFECYNYSHSTIQIIIDKIKVIFWGFMLKYSSMAFLVLWDTSVKFYGWD